MTESMTMDSARDVFFTETRDQGSLKRSKSEADIAEVSNRVMADAKGSAIPLTTADRKELIELRGALQTSHASNIELKSLLEKAQASKAAIAALMGRMTELEAERRPESEKVLALELQKNEVEMKLNEVQIQLERLKAENADLKKKNNGIEKHGLVDWLLG